MDNDATGGVTVTPSVILILLSATVCTVGGWLYFQHVQMPRPPIGVFSLSDVLMVFVFIVLMPMLYIWLPTWMMIGLLLVSGLSLVYFVLEPLKSHRLIWMLTLILIGADLLSGFALGTQHPIYQCINNIVIALGVISISNTWAQSGMKARDAAILGSLLIVYDFIASTQYSLMGDLFARLSTLPLSPLMMWGQGEQYVAIGLGDLLMLTVFPLTMYKGFGMRAGLIALIVGLTAVTALVMLPIINVFPVMVVLSPLIVIQYIIWRRRSPERSMKEMFAAQADSLVHLKGKSFV
jgi:hypothetical protein